VVTKVAILTPPRSPSVHVAFLACPTYEAVLVSGSQQRCLSLNLSLFVTRSTHHSLTLYDDALPLHMAICQTCLTLADQSGSSASRVHRYQKLQLLQYRNGTLGMLYCCSPGCRRHSRRPGGI